MPKQDAAAILREILSEADALIRLRLKEQGLELPHLVVGATPDEVMRSFGEDLKNVADELNAPPEPARGLASFQIRTGVGGAGVVWSC